MRLDLFVELKYQSSIIILSTGYKYSECDLLCDQKMTPFVLYALISPNIDRFSNLFHCQNQQNIFNNNVTKNPTTFQECTYTTL